MREHVRGEDPALGARKAKELLFTGDSVSAGNAADLGMVNHVVPDDQLAELTLSLATRIAERPAFGLRLAKASVNRILKAQGQESAIDAPFALHNPGHANNLARHGDLVDPAGARIIRESSSKVPVV